MKLINKIKFKVLTIFIIILLSNKLHSRALKPENEDTFENKNKKIAYIKYNTLDYNNFSCNKIHACKDAVIKFKKYLKDDEFLKKIMIDYFRIENLEINQMHKFFEDGNLIFLKKYLNDIDDKIIIKIYKKDLLTIVDSNLNFKNFFNYLKKFKTDNINRLNALLEIVNFVSEKLTKIKYTSLSSVKYNKELSKFSLYGIGYYTTKFKNNIIMSPQPLIFTNSIKEKEDVPAKFFKNNIASVLLIKFKDLKNCNGLITEDKDIILEPYSFYKVTEYKKTEFSKNLGDNSYQILFKEVTILCLNEISSNKNIIRTIYG